VALLTLFLAQTLSPFFFLAYFFFYVPRAPIRGTMGGIFLSPFDGKFFPPSYELSLVPFGLTLFFFLLYFFVHR